MLRHPKGRGFVHAICTHQLRHQLLLTTDRHGNGGYRIDDPGDAPVRLSRNGIKNKCGIRWMDVVLLGMIRIGCAAFVVGMEQRVDVLQRRPAAEAVAHHSHRTIDGSDQAQLPDGVDHIVGAGL